MKLIMLFNFKNLAQIHLIHKSVDFRKGVVGLNYLLYEQGYEEYNIGEVFIDPQGKSTDFKTRI